jgi:hypothetical protein
MKTQTAVPQITGQGTTKDGHRVFAVASRTESNHWYLVVVGEHSLECQCKASQYRGKCAHRQAVHDRLVEERSAQREAEATAAAKARDAAPIYRDNRAFSIFKS